MTTLSRLIHASFTSKEMGALIESAATGLNGADYDTNAAALIRVLRKSHHADATKLPTDYVMRRTAVSANARSVWEKARAENDFASFRPWLEQVVTLAQEAAELYGYQDDPYDALIDKYEAEARTEEVRQLFRALRESLVPLREAIAARGRKVDDRLLHQHFPIEGSRRSRATSPPTATTSSAAISALSSIHSPSASARTTCASRRAGIPLHQPVGVRNLA